MRDAKKVGHVEPERDDRDSFRDARSVSKLIRRGQYDPYRNLMRKVQTLQNLCSIDVVPEQFRVNNEAAGGELIRADVLDQLRDIPLVTDTNKRIPKDRLGILVECRLI